MTSISEGFVSGEEADGPKRDAAHAAVERYVESGMVLGLGSGTTARCLVRRLGELLASGDLDGVRGIPTSEETARLAREMGVPLVTLAEERPDLTLDGADEIIAELEALKGWGGALLREKIVASASRQGLVVIADRSKLVGSLGGGPLPVEVEPFGYEATLRALAALGCEPELRLSGWRPFVTDGGHYTVDCRFPEIPYPVALEEEIRRIPGALECGIFVGLLRGAVLAREDEVEILGE